MTGNGPPYTTGTLSSLADAQAIARSAHPSRVVATTGSYRYARFEECGGEVQVTMMREHIATYLRYGVRLWSRGHPTPSTSAALTTLAPYGRFSHKAGVLYYDAEDGRHPDVRHEEGALYPYRAGDTPPDAPSWARTSGGWFLAGHDANPGWQVTDLAIAQIGRDATEKIFHGLPPLPDEAWKVPAS